MQSQASRIRRNSLFAFLSQLIRLLTNFLMFVGIARLYGPEAFGQFTTAHTLSIIFLLFADFGFDTLLATEVARYRDRATEIAQRYFSLKMIFAVVAAVGLMIFPVFQSMNRSTIVLVEVFSLNVFFTALSNFFFALFKGYEQLHHETRISFLVNILSLCLLFIAWTLHFPLYVFAIIFIIARLFGFLLALRIASQITQTSFFRLDYSGWREILKQVVIFGLLVLFGNLCFQLDTILLASMKSAYDVGVYQAVFRLVVLTLVVPEITTNALMPVLSRLNNENEVQWNVLGRLLNKTLTFIALVISIVTFTCADQIINLIYGIHRFSESVPLLRIFSLIIVIRFAVETYGLMLTTSLRQKERMFVVMFATILNFILNVYAIPRYGTTGAAMVSLITNVFIGFGYIFATRSFFSGWEVKPKNGLPLIITAIVAIVLWKIRLWPVWYIGPIAIATCSTVFYLLGYTKEERKLVFAFKDRIRIGRA